MAACGTEEAANTFESDPGPLDIDLRAALSSDVDPDLVPAVQRSFLIHCVKGGGVELPELESVQRDGLVSVCGCSYDAVVDYAFDTVRRSASDFLDTESVDLSVAAFELFTEIDDELKTAGTELNTQVADLVRTCVLSESGL